MKFPRHKLYIDFKTLIISFITILFTKEKISKNYFKLQDSFRKYFNIKNIYFLSTWRLGFYFVLKSFNLQKDSEVIITGIGIPDKIFSKFRSNF